MEELPSALERQGFPGAAASLRTAAAVALARVMSTCSPGAQYAKLMLQSAEAMSDAEELLFEEGLGDEAVALPCVRLFLTTAVVPSLSSPAGPVLERIMPLIVPLIPQVPAHPHGRALRLCFLDLLSVAFSKGLDTSEAGSTGSVALQLVMDWACGAEEGIDAAVRVRCLKVRTKLLAPQNLM
jgi:hypothetical protein